MNDYPLVLISELVTIDHGKYIVKVTIEKDGMIVATGLGGAHTVEEAEDNARTRAMAIVTPSQNTSEAKTATSQAMASTPKPNITSTSKTITPKEKPTIIAQTPEKEPDIISTPQKEIPTSVTPPTEVKSSVSVPLMSQPEPPREPPVSPPPAAANHELEAISVPAEPEPNFSELPLSFSSVPDEPTDTEEFNHDSTAEQLNAETVDNPTPSPTEVSESLESIDFSQIIHETSIELKRLGWTNEDGKNYLLQTYGKKSRHVLSDEQLIEFLQYLKQQP